jgi:PadR family transcriptional regulator PadR
MSPGLRWRGGRGGGPCPRRIRRFIEPALLLLLHIDSGHGYNLVERLGELGLEDYPVDPSVVYRTLRQLERAGMITSDWDVGGAAGPPRRVYRLTEAGTRYLATWVADLRETDRVLHRFLGAYDEHIEDGEGDYH